MRWTKIISCSAVVRIILSLAFLVTRKKKIQKSAL